MSRQLEAAPGLTVVDVRRSPARGKRYRVTFRTKNGPLQTSDFGSASSSVFRDLVPLVWGVAPPPTAKPDHGDPVRRRNWHARHGARLVDGVPATSRVGSPAWWSANLLW